ncbi:MAG: PQQ-like beta-propeller repeat protein [Acidobacteriia bacterium]|nr:PQQ-like beta-propeller repeat protein [Terriglobia bacterium]
MKSIWLALALCVHAEDWPQWRGPASQGISSETGVAVEWSASSKNIAWKAGLAGTGTSSPVVSNGLVIVTSQVGSYGAGDGGDPRLARDDRSLAVREKAIGGASGKVFLAVEAFRVSDGKRAWEYRMEAIGEEPELHEKHNLATPTPVTGGERIHAWFGNGQVVTLDFSGREIWKKALAPEHGSFVTQWGHGSSPMLHKGLLLLLVDHRPVAYLLALDAKTGAERWKVERGRGKVAHSTPVVVPGARGDELLINSNERIDVYDPANGKLAWSHGTERQTPIPSAVHAGGMIYLTRGYRNSDVLALAPGGELKWRLANGGSYVPSILHYQGLLYMTNEVGVVSCVEASTGAVVWKERLMGIFFASPVAADGKIYLVSETGETFVMRAGRKAEVLAKNVLEERFVASPAISGGTIFLRGDGTLTAIRQAN